MSQFIPVLSVFITLIILVNCYRYRLIPFEESFDRCRNITCKDDELHSICLQNNCPPSNCTNFKYLEMTPKRQRILINGHNGIRNKIANTLMISNMLLLHWDEDLYSMARGFLSRCLIGRDSCDFIVNENYTIGQTYYFNPKLPLNRFVVTIMRYWFLEANNISTFDEFVEQKPANMTQLTYPLAQFFGCAAAEMLNGHMMRCYYSPGYVDNSKLYHLGKPCSDCPIDRSSCSRIFKGLCGVDVPLPSCNKRFTTNFTIFSFIVMLVVSLILSS